MSKGLSDFLVKNSNGLLYLDIKKARQIPPSEFRRRYIEDMQTYFDNHNKPTITCWDCNREISSASELFRYFGANLHKECLVKRYEADTAKPLVIGGWEREYFDLILEAAQVALQ